MAKDQKKTTEVYADYDDQMLLYGELSPDIGVLVSPKRHEFYISNSEKLGVCMKEVSECAGSNFWLGAAAGVGTVGVLIFIIQAVTKK